MPLDKVQGQKHVFVGHNFTVDYTSFALCTRQRNSYNRMLQYIFLIIRSHNLRVKSDRPQAKTTSFETRGIVRVVSDSPVLRFRHRSLDRCA